jgi:outer membrane protein OmpA-like peptidoglycan-associated protein
MGRGGVAQPAAQAKTAAAIANEPFIHIGCYHTPVPLPLIIPLALALAATPLRVEIDSARIDLAGRRLELRMNHPAGQVEVTLMGEEGETPLLQHAQDFRGRAANERLELTWPDPHGKVARIDIRAHDDKGLWVSQSFAPWWVSIPHQEVNFATDSAEITGAEAPKLEGSLEQIKNALTRYRHIGPIKLYVAGHTDTVGTADYNRQLSRRRARAIAGWFRKHGLPAPVFYEGFGESALKVATADETDEPRNRRVDYILGVSEPLRPAGGRSSWKSAE